MTERGWFSLGRVLFSDPLTRPTGVWPEALALAYLAAVADWETGEIRAPLRELALEWEWPHARVQRFLDALLERGWLRAEWAGRGKPRKLFAAWPWERRDTLADTAGDTVSDTEKVRLQAVPRQERDTLSDTPADTLSDTLGDLPSALPSSSKEEEQEISPSAGARARGNPRPGYLKIEGKHPVAGVTVKKLVGILAARCLFGVELEGELYEQQARPIAALIAKHGPEKVEQAILGAARRSTWPFDKRGEPITAFTIARHFTAALAAAAAPDEAQPAVAGRNGNGNGEGAGYSWAESERRAAETKRRLEATLGPAKPGAPGRVVVALPGPPPAAALPVHRSVDDWRADVAKRLAEAPKETRREMVDWVKQQHAAELSGLPDGAVRKAFIQEAGYLEYGRRIGMPRPI